LRYLRIAQSYIHQAGARLQDAVDAHREKNHPYAVRLSQECVELSLKAVLRGVGLEYPRTHEISYILTQEKERFPEWFRAEVEYMERSSKLLFAKREPSLHGDESSILSPDEVMSSGDAEDATKRANRVFGLCSKLVQELEEKTTEKASSRKSRKD